jgi:hypothetical protein
MNGGTKRWIFCEAFINGGKSPLARGFGWIYLSEGELQHVDDAVYPLGICERLAHRLFGRKRTLRGRVFGLINTVSRVLGFFPGLRHQQTKDDGGWWEQGARMKRICFTICLFISPDLDGETVQKGYGRSRHPLSLTCPD